ncbi:glycosyltransferase involved in cell wall biosynthesis [Pseudonocardia sediminis]|uniref:Glycosyltransferase involved in cell wall biosynthesis n=1 Tax=Pseudonocardia sediminis TaxID=1397368 RepID=A0A4Q7V0R9_PSEST|nr:glycosyltransferase [Pseudonocardia sediminis]RZT87886.1 glycosyltransferase involved in cell wall biosynthesis [Pseudonocardia sediminis]
MTTSETSPLNVTAVLDHVELGGAEKLLLDLFRHFDPTVVAPRLICLKHDGDLAPDFRDSGFPVEVLSRRGRFDRRTVPQLVRSFRTHRTDVVLVNHYARAPLTLGRLAARLAGVPANVVAVHGIDLVRHGGRCLPRHDLETLFLSDALALIGPAQASYLHTQEGVGRYMWRRIREEIIPNGISLPPVADSRSRLDARSRLGLTDREQVVSIVARLRPEKAHDVLLDAIALLAPSHPEVRLVVVGDGPEEPRLRERAGRLGIAGRVLFMGRRNDVAALLPASDVSVLCSQHEAAPIAVIEAMAAGLPVVVSDCGGLPDMVTDDVEGYRVAVGDPAALAAAISRVLDDGDVASRLGSAGRARAERDFRIESTARRFEELFTSLVTT